MPETMGVREVVAYGVVSAVDDLPEFIVKRGAGAVAPEVAKRGYFLAFGRRSAMFLLRQWGVRTGLCTALAAAVLWLALRAYRESIFGARQRRGAVLRDHSAHVRARRRRAVVLHAAVSAVMAVPLGVLVFDISLAQLAQYIKAEAFVAVPAVRVVLAPEWSADVLWIDGTFRGGENVVAAMRAQFGGRSALRLLAGHVFVGAWIAVAVALVRRQWRTRVGRRGEGGYRLAGVELEAGKECYHVLLCGSPGSGKSTACKDLLDQIRVRGERAIVYDLSGEYLRLYFRPGRDRLLSPSDARSETWSPWAEGDDPATYLALARSLFPGGGRDPFWQEAAATLFAAALEKLAADGSNQRLYFALTQGSIEDLRELLADTDAARFLDPNGSAMPASVIATVASGLKGWRQLVDPVTPSAAFSIRRFIRGEGEADDSWLFLSTTEADRIAMKPLLSLWADVAATALLSLPETHASRIWAVFDEVASLQRLPALPGLLERGRKHGAAVLLGLQAIPQLREAYGRDLAAAIAAQPQTWLVLRSVEPDTAKWLESALGTVEVEEAHTSLSMGVDAMRDGVSFQQHVTHRPLVLASEITTLPDLTGYLKLPGAPDLWRVAYGIREREDIAAPFVPRARRRPT
ncbi:MAG: type IV secretion system DNA-binding domain-containing protein [Deltaproteobacteria bacterium]